MPAIIRVVDFAVTSGVSSGTFDVTDPDLGTIDGGIVFVSGATAADLTRADDTLIAVGFFDGTASEKSISGYANNGSASGDTNRKQNDSSVIEHITTSGTQGRFAVDSIITGGVRFVYEASFTAAYRGFAILFQGMDAFNLESSTNLDGGSSTAIGAKPDVIIVGGTTGSTSHSTGEKVAFGVACRDPSDDSVTQWGTGLENQDSPSTVQFLGGIKTGKILLRTSGTSNYYDEYDLASFDSSGYTFAASPKSRSLTNVRILSLKLPSGQQALCGVDTMPTSTGAKNITTNYASGDDDSEVLLIYADDNTSDPGTQPDHMDCASFGAADSDGNESVVVLADDQGNPTTQSQSAFSNTNIVHLVTGGSGTVINTADTTNITGGNATLNFSAGTTANRFGWLAIQAGAAGGITLSPGVISTTDTLYGPTLSAGAISITPDQISTSDTLHQPSLATGVAIEPAQITTVSQLFAVTLAAGGISLTPDQIATLTTAYGPTLSAGAISITPAQIASSDTLYGPTLSAGGITLTPDQIATLTTAYGPNLSAGGISLTPDQIATLTTAYGPIVSEGLITVSPDAIATASTIYVPALQAGAITIAPSLISTSDTLDSPSILQGTFLLPDSIGTSSTTYIPVIASGPVAVTPGLIATSSTLQSPSIVITITADQIATATTMYGLTIVHGAVTISAGLIDTSTTIYVPVILGGAQSEFIKMALEVEPAISFAVGVAPVIELDIDIG